jgi:hypothetical protein
MELATRILFAFGWVRMTAILLSRSRGDIKGEALGLLEAAAYPSFVVFG